MSNVINVTPDDVAQSITGEGVSIISVDVVYSIIPYILLVAIFISILVIFIEKKVLLTNQQLVKDRSSTR